MTQKRFYKQLTSLALSLCLVASSSLIYAADGTQGDAYFTEDIVEGAVTGDGSTVEESITEDGTTLEESVTGDAATDEAAVSDEVFGVDDETMELLQAGSAGDEAAFLQFGIDGDGTTELLQSESAGDEAAFLQSVSDGDELTEFHQSVSDGDETTEPLESVSDADEAAALFQPGNNGDETLTSLQSGNDEEIVSGDGIISDDLAASDAAFADSKSVTLEPDGKTSVTVASLYGKGYTDYIWSLESRQESPVSGNPISWTSTETCYDDTLLAGTSCTGVNKATVKYVYKLSPKVSTGTARTFTVTATAAYDAAQIGQVYYPSVKAALTAAADGDTVTMLKTDRTVDSTIELSGKVTLVLGDFTLSNANNILLDALIAVKGSGCLTLKGTNGAVTNTNTNGLAVSVSLDNQLKAVANLLRNPPKVTDGYIWLEETGNEETLYTLTSIKTAFSTPKAKIKLFSNVLLSEPASVTAGDITLDLNGKQFKLRDYGGTVLTVTGKNANSGSSGTSGNAAAPEGGSSANNSGNAAVPNSTGDGAQSTEPIAFYVIDSMGGGMITTNDPNGNAVRIENATLYAGSGESKQFTISSNGDAVTGRGVMVIEKGSITSKKGAGVSGAFDMTISGGTVTGATNGVELTSGSLIANGGTVVPGTGSSILLGTNEETAFAFTTVSLYGTNLSSAAPLKVLGLALPTNGFSFRTNRKDLVNRADIRITQGSLWVKASLLDYYELVGTGGTGETAYVTQHDDDLLIVAGNSTDFGTVKITKDVTFDLNGRTIAGTGPILDVSGGSSTIYDTIGGGAIDAETNAVIVEGSEKVLLTLSLVRDPYTMRGGDVVLLTNTNKDSCVTVDGVAFEGGTDINVGAEMAAGSGTGKAYAGSLDIKNGTFSGLKNLEVTAAEPAFNRIRVFNSALDVTDAVKVVIPSGYVWVTGSDAAELLSARDAFSKADGTIVLYGDLVLSEGVTISKKITLDLNGHKVSPVSGDSTEGAWSGTDYLIGIRKGGDLTVINSDGDTDGEIGSGTKYSIQLLSSGTGAVPKLTLGSDDSALNEFEVSGKSVGIFSDRDCEVAVYGGAVNGMTAIEIDQGKLGIEDGQFTGTIPGGTSNAIVIGGSSGASVEIAGGLFSATNALKITNTKAAIKVSGGSFGGAVSAPASTKEFLTGGIYSAEPAEAYVNIAEGYAVKDNTDPVTKVEYPYMVSPVIPRYKVTVIAPDPKKAAEPPVCTPEDTSSVKEGSKVTVKAGEAAEGYLFVGWSVNGAAPANDERELVITVEADTTLEPIYAKPVKVIGPKMDIASGTEFKGDKSAVTYEGIDVDGADDVDGLVIDDSKMTITAPNYNKDTSKIGSYSEIVVQGAAIMPEYAKEYVIASYEDGQLHIVASENVKAFTDAAAALPDPETVKSTDRKEVDATKEAYDRLTTAEKEAAEVSEAKARLDKVEAAVAAAEAVDKAAADEVKAKIAAIRSAKAGAGKAAAEEARKAYEKLTPEQKTFVDAETLASLEEAEAAYKEGKTFTAGDGKYKVLSNGNVTFLAPVQKDLTYVAVPNQVKKNGYLYKVVKISINAFKDCNKLTKVLIHKNIVSIGKCAFKNTPALKRLIIKGTGVKSVASAFTGAGMNQGRNLACEVPSSKVRSYNSLFKGEGNLNADATVKAYA